MGAFPLERDIDYPESDGQPLAETELHIDVIVDLRHVLRMRYQAEPEVYVGANLNLYYVRGDPQKVVSPDVFLARGVAPGVRRVYKLWQEGKAPSLVVEVTSASSRQKDLEKKEIYARLGVEEYFLFDPLDEYLRPRLQGFRLVRGTYRPIPADRDGSLPSQVTGLRLRAEGERLRLIDLASGEKLLWTTEEAAAREREAVARQAAEARTVEEAAARRAAEARIAEERHAREREATARQAAEARAVEETAARRAAEARATEEATTRRSLEEELERLRRELGRRSSEPPRS
jgi:Uma2 family endonuclease